MTTVAGVDVGNTTTEIVVCRLVPPAAPQPLVWDRRPTLGVKGSPSSWAGAARLLSSLERRVGAQVDVVVITDQHPVSTQVRAVAAPEVETGRIWSTLGGSGTPGGRGVAVGMPQPVEAAVRTDLGPVVLVAQDPLGFRQTVNQVSAWIDAGAQVVGVVLAGDEARLVASRILGWSGPVLDGVDTAKVLGCERVAVEVGAESTVVRQVNDGVWVGSALGVPPAARGEVTQATARLAGATAGLIGVLPAPLSTADARAALEARRHDAAAPSSRAPGTTATPPAVRDPGQLAELDAWSVDLARVVPAYVRTLRASGIATAVLSRPDPADPAAPGGPPSLRAVGAAFGDRQVRVLGTEALAARCGAATTPGVVPHDPPAVLDLGGGTIDLIVAGHEVTAAGSGDLLTVATAHVLGTSRAAAEWVKRGPCLRIESPRVVADEGGQRHFRDDPAPPGTVGWLTVAGPSGPLPFSAALQPGDWRAARWALKRATLADNVTRLVAALPPGVHLGADLILVGGPAGDDEVLDILAGALPHARLGRADVAGRLGHRWAVAYGLALLATGAQEVN